jgi:Carboxypeptidase regulatory-like domain
MKSLSPMCVASLGLPARVRMVRRAAYLGLFAFLLAIFTTSAFAQEATIVGTVTDPSGAAVANAKITLTNSDTGISRVIDTGTDGQYVAPDLHIGHYNVSANASGFKVGQQSGIVLNVGDRTRVDFKLQVGSAQEQVTVEANAVAVQTDTGEVSGVVTGQQITQLATNGRSVASLEALQPGASSIQSDFVIPTSSTGDFNVSFNGQRVVHNLWLIDGDEAADRGGGGGAIVLPSEDAIAEFRTMTSNYSAEYGLSSAGTMSMVIKSGTKALHAGAWYFGRNNALDARNYFNPAPNQYNPTPDPVSELRLHVFGFNAGGPVSLHPSKSNPKTFWFYNQEWRRYITGGLFSSVVPLASWYPDAGGSGTGAVLPTATPSGAAINTLVPANIASIAPTCTGLTPGKPFPNNTIPDCAVSANAKALLGAGIFPNPSNQSTWTNIGQVSQPITAGEQIARIDHTFTDRFSIFGHWISDQSQQTYGETLWSSDNVPTVGNTYGNPSYSATVHATYAIHPNLLNEVAFNYDGNRIHILPHGIYQAPSGFTFNKIFSGVNVDNRIPDIHLNDQLGSFYTANWLPWNNTANDYQGRDDLSWVRGAHQLKFGFGYAMYIKTQDYFAETQGGFQFNGSATGFDYADFILGEASNYNENAYKGTGYWYAPSPDAYVQDNWRTTSRLTLNLGLRWDGIPHTYEDHYNQSSFYPTQYNPANAPTWVAGSNYGQIASNSPGLFTPTNFDPGFNIPSLQPYSFYLNGMGVGGKNGNPRGLAKNAWLNFGPRIGFAYDLTGTGKTVIRGGYGLMYERIQGNDMYDGATNAPFGYSLGTTNVLLNNPHVGWTGSTITVPIVPSSVVAPYSYYPAPRTSSYSLGVQRAVAANAVLSVSYVGSLDRHESYFQEIDLAPFADLGCLQQGNCPATTPAYNGLVPYQGYSSIKMAFNGGNSHYNSLQAELRGNVTHDLTLQVAYTLSKAIDFTTGNGGNGWDLDYITNPYAGWQYDVGRSVFDRRNIAFVNFVYDLPFLRNSSSHLLKTTVGGWELSGIVTAESGAPYNLALGGGGVSNSFFPGGDVTNRPNLVGTISYPHTLVSSNGRPTGLQWINPAAFAAPAAGTFGNLPFDGVNGPGRDNWNLSLFKRFIISESRGSEFQFRAESFNTWNHTQFGNSGQNGGFSTNLTSSNFGQITGAFDPRVFQLGAKLIF